MPSNPKTYSLLSTPIAGSTGTGLDQLIGMAQRDPGLTGQGCAKQITAGLEAAKNLILLIKQAAVATHAAANGTFSNADVMAMNAWIRTNKLAEFTKLHGDDDGTVETGFHLLQGNGGTSTYRGTKLIDAQMDSLFHIGFEIKNSRFQNEDGAANASVSQVAAFLTQFWTDRATSDTGLDDAVMSIQADAGLAKISNSQEAAGMNAANEMNKIIVKIVADQHLLADNKIDVADLQSISTAIQGNVALKQAFTTFHGSDAGGKASGFHNVVGDGGSATIFGQKLVDTVLEGIYDIGFATKDGHVTNERGASGAQLTDVASWLDFYLSDVSTTNTGLDRITDTIKMDIGLTAKTSAAHVMEGARSANNLNMLLVQGINALNLDSDGWIGVEDLLKLSNWVNANDTRKATFLNNHGDDNNGEETGFHNVQGDGGTVNYFGQKLINTVADGIYHFGFNVRAGRFENEDGNLNAQLSDVSAWLNTLYKGTELIQGDNNADTIQGTDAAEVLSGRLGNDMMLGGGGNDLLMGGDGDDALSGGAGNDQLYGGIGQDKLDGGDGSDTYVVMGSSGSFEGYDSYDDTGSSGTDTIIMAGNGNVTLGLTAISGIEVIDARGVAAGYQALIGGDSSDNRWNFSKVTFMGNLMVTSGAGNDWIFGSSGADTLQGGIGNDTLNGGIGNDKLYGEGGDDLFVFDSKFGQDIIVDFNIGHDHIKLGNDLLEGACKFTIFSGQLKMTLGMDSITFLNLYKIPTDTHVLFG